MSDKSVVQVLLKKYLSTSGGGEAKKRKYHKYDDTISTFSIEVSNEEKPQCELRLKILSSESRLPVS